MLDQCAEMCNNDPECKAFEHCTEQCPTRSGRTMNDHCVLSTGRLHGNLGNNSGFIFCSKGIFAIFYCDIQDIYI